MALGIVNGKVNDIYLLANTHKYQTDNTYKIINFKTIIYIPYR